MSIKVGIIGCGKIAQVRHIPEYAEHKDAKLLGFYDINLERAADLAKQYGGTAYATVEELLANPEIHAVSICAANFAHAELTIAALNAGKHVLCEKPMAITEASDEPFRLLPWLSHLYIIGALIMLVIRLWQFARMHRLIRRGCLWSDVEDGITIHCHADDVAPCSWMRHIVISEHDYRHHRHEILLHEKGHVRSLHSWDILLLMLVQTIQWYNPFAYMLGASLRDVHEYEADDYVLRQGVTISEYQTLLLKTAVGVGKYTFANNFNHCFICFKVTSRSSRNSTCYV